MKVLITGSNGQLGHDFQRLFDEKKINYDATDYKELDITAEEEMKKYVVGKNYTHIINCAAYNDVDKAEIEKEKCYNLNSKAPQGLAKIAKEIGAIFVTYSTDFVFDREEGEEIKEEDLPNPPSIYAKSKEEGERQVLEAYEKSFVIRTSWVFGIANNNFNDQVINWSQTKDNLNIVDDQVSVPTYSMDLAIYSWKLIETNKFGLYHLTNNGQCSKYDQAKYVLEKINWMGTLGKAKTKDFNLSARRSKYSKLSNKKIEDIIGEKIPSWKDGIDRYLKELKK